MDNKALDDFKRMTGIAQQEIDKLEAMGKALIAAGWDGNAPTKEGYYFFQCGETPEPELVLVDTCTLSRVYEKHKGRVYSDGMWNNLEVFHHNLTYPMWKKVDHRKLVESVN